MFWRKKEEQKKLDRFTTLYIPIAGAFGGYRELPLPAYKHEKMETEKCLAFHEEVVELEKKINLILEHLNLKYVPETEKKEPAKLVENKSGWIATCDALCGAITGSSCTYGESKPKKKRGRPKKK